MMRHITIEQFGPIKKIDIDLNKNLEVIIGPQASGKSTFIKAVYFCRKIRDYFLQYLSSVINTEVTYTDELYTNFLKYIRRPFMGYFGTTKHMENFIIRYYYDKETDRYVSIGLDRDRYAKFNFSKSLKEDICNMIREAVKVAANSNKNPFSVNILEKNNFLIGAKKTIERIFEDDFMLLYIPAGRNLLTILPDGIASKGISLSSHYEQDNEVDISQTDLITQEFAQYIRDVRSGFGSKLDEIVQNYIKTVKGQIRNQDVDLARQLVHDILRGDYVFDKEGEKLYYDKEHWVKLMFSSSGQQEIVWALNIIFLEILKNEKTFLVFEEPESHLFPDSQEKIAQLTALLINSSNSQVVITTHSPYMLTAFNLLIYSGVKEKEAGAEDSVIRKEFRVVPESVGAYFIPAETGCLKNIVSKKRGLIDALQIDGISESINERMDRILYNSVDNRRLSYKSWRINHE